MSKRTAHRVKQRKALPSTWDAAVQEDAGAGLNRERIVQAGVAIADRHGLTAVSIRRIAAQLKSSPMALYHYVPSKRDLLNLMLDACHAEFEWPAAPITGWRGILSHFARESRRSLKRHPWASTLRAADPEYGPGGIRTLESLLARLFEFGLDMRTAIRAIGVLFVFVNGFVTAETAPRKPANQPRFSKAILATGRFPNVARFVELGAELPDDEGFERALNWILDGIEADFHAHARVHTARRKKSA